MRITEHAISQYQLRIDNLDRDDVKRKIFQVINHGSEVIPKWKTKKSTEHFYVAMDILVIIENNLVVTVERLGDIISEGLYGKKDFDVIQD